ncbi:MAG: hypothetical protein ACE5OS_04085 [Anaerolineae bacterium]
MDWIQVLYSDVVPWLMEPSDPSVRYWTLTRLLGRTEEAEVAEARRAITERGPAVEILSHYAGDGHWEGEKSYYTYKYTSTHWQLLLLAELAADGQDERIAAACQRMIDEVHRDSRPIIWPCFHGNLIGYLHALGHGEDERVHQFEAELARAGTTGRWRCNINGDHPCAWGAARALWGFGHIPVGERSSAVEEAIDSGIRFLGRFKLREGNYPSSGPRHKLWDRLNFPLFYQADVLFTLRALADLGRVDEKPTFRKAVMWLEDRCRDDGRWNGASPYGSRMWTQLEHRRRPSKWVTWQALYVIKAAYS